MSVTGPIRYLVIGNSTYEIYNTDTKVTQTASTPSRYTYWRPLIIGYSSGSTAVTAPTTQTNTTYAFSTLMVQPSSGTIRFGTAALYNGDYTVSLTPTTLTENRTITLPNNTGTLALTSDIPSAATAIPIMNGTAAVGTSAKYAREDHVHPSDTTKVDKEALDDAGISGESYSTVADTTTVTTSASQYHPNPYGTISSTTDLINLRNYYRITFNGAEYILPSQEWFINTSGGDFTYSTKGLIFIGNLSYFGNATGFYDTLYDVPFLISDAVLTGENTYSEGLYLFTNASTSATVKIELITYNFTKLPRVLLNGYSNLPIYQVVGSSFAESYNIGVNNFPYRRGAVAIGIGNTVNTNNACVLIGTGNEVSAKGGNAIGFRCTVSGEFSSAFGFATNASGSYSHSNGCHTTASGDFGASADGYKTTASGDYSSAIGYVSTASGNGSTASGIETTSSGNGSVSSGYQTLASGYFSNAKGYGSISKNRSQMAFGEFNIQDTSSNGRSKRGNFVEIVGNGTADDARSNARTLDWSGNESLAGGLTLGMGTANQTSITAQQLNALLALVASVPNAASIDANGLITFKNGNTSLFTLQLPIYNGAHHSANS